MRKRINQSMLFAVGLTLPFETIGNFHIGAFSITPAKVITALALVFGLLDILFSGRRVPRNPKNLFMVWLFAAFLLSAVYGSFVSGIGGTTYFLIAFRYVSLLLFYVLLCQLISTRQDLDALFYGLVLGGSLAALSAFFGEVRVHEFTERRSGIAAKANQQAGNLLLILPLAYALFFTARYRLLKPFLIGSAGLLAVGVVAAASRSGFLAALAMGGAWMLRFRRPSDLRYVVAMALVFLIGAIAAPNAYLHRLGTIKDAIVVATGGSVRGGTGTADILARFEAMRAGFGAMLSSPFGAGVANFGPWAVRNGYKIDIELSVHNAVLECGAELGIVGLVPYLAILVLTWTQLSRAQRIARGLRMRKDDELGHLYLRAVMVQIGFIGIAVVTQFQPGFLWKGMWVVFGVSTAVLALVERRARELRASEPGWSPALAASGALRAEPARG